MPAESAWIRGVGPIPPRPRGVTATLMSAEPPLIDEMPMRTSGLRRVAEVLFGFACPLGAGSPMMGRCCSPRMKVPRALLGTRRAMPRGQDGSIRTARGPTCHRKQRRDLCFSCDALRTQKIAQSSCLPWGGGPRLLDPRSGRSRKFTFNGRSPCARFGCWPFVPSRSSSLRRVAMVVPVTPAPEEPLVVV